MLQVGIHGARSLVGIQQNTLNILEYSKAQGSENFLDALKHVGAALGRSVQIKEEIYPASLTYLDILNP